MRVAAYTSKRPGVHLNFENKTNNRHRIRKTGQTHISLVLLFSMDCNFE